MTELKLAAILAAPTAVWFIVWATTAAGIMSEERKADRGYRRLTKYCMEGMEFKEALRLVLEKWSQS